MHACMHARTHAARCAARDPRCASGISRGAARKRVGPMILRPRLTADDIKSPGLETVLHDGAINRRETDDIITRAGCRFGLANATPPRSRSLCR